MEEGVVYRGAAVLEGEMRAELSLPYNHPEELILSGDGAVPLRQIDEGLLSSVYCISGTISSSVQTPHFYCCQFSKHTNIHGLKP